MSALQVSGNNLVRVNGRLAIVTGVDELAQKLTISLRYFLGEWFRDENVGVPWFERIFIKNPQPSEITSLLRRAVLAVPGIVSIDSLTYDFDSTLRKLRVVIKAKSVTGETIDLDQSFTPFATEI